MKRTLSAGDLTVQAEVESLGDGRYRVRLGERQLECSLRVEAGARVQVQQGGAALDLEVTRAGRDYFVSSAERDFTVGAAAARRRASAQDHHGRDEISLPMPGKVVKVMVAAGDAVKKGQPLLVVEAMKMEHTLKSPRDGVVAKLAAREGEMADAGRILLELESAPEAPGPPALEK